MQNNHINAHAFVVYSNIILFHQLTVLLLAYDRIIVHH